MVNGYTFPNANINLLDKSAGFPADPTIVPIHLPIFPVFAEMGPVGIPVLGGSQSLQQQFGSLFLNERSPYFQHQNVFLKRALQYQQVYMVRLADPAAYAASLVILCTLTTGTVTQYQRNSNGSIIYNSQGQPTPQLQSDGVTVTTQPGVTLTWSTRPLGEGETLTNIEPVTNGNATTYPIMAVQGTVGAAGANQGFRLFYTPNFDSSAVANIGALTYSFQPVSLNATTNIESPTFDIYSSQTQTFSFMPGAYDPTTASYYELSDVIANDFNGLPGLPYQFYVYGANVGTIGTEALAVSPELGGISPYLVNIASGVDQSNNPYEHIVISAGSTAVLNPNVVLYLQGGSDGQLTKTMLENLTEQFYAGDLYPQIADSFRYQFTHIYDSGYSLATKQAIMSIFSLRDDVKIDFSTQDVALPANTAAQDQSTGSALRTAALLNPESTDLGTQACRVSIYQQCGTLSDTTLYTKIVPATIDRLIKRCIYNGTDHVTGEPKGRPNSEVSILNIGSINWTPTTPQQQQLSWNTGLNYIQYCDLQTLFYADLLSVYPIDSSLLSSDVLVDYAAVYLKHIIRRQWTIIVGRDDPPKTLFQTIAKGIDAAAAYVFNGNLTTSTVVTQTAVDTALGYQLTVTTTVIGNPTNRVWKVIVPITRAAA